MMTYAYDVPKRELHHRIPQCLLTLRDRADSYADPLSGEAIETWMIYEWECATFGLDPDIPRDNLEATIDNSTFYMREEDHRNHHSQNGDFQKWGSRGGRETCRRYGVVWFSMISRKRWGKITAEELTRYREEILIG